MCCCAVILQANKPEYHLLDPDKFLRQQLAGKTVIEFPVLLVLLPGEEAKYILAESEKKAFVPFNAADLKANALTHDTI